MISDIYYNLFKEVADILQIEPQICEKLKVETISQIDTSDLIDICKYLNQVVIYFYMNDPIEYNMSICKTETIIHNIVIMLITFRAYLDYRNNIIINPYEIIHLSKIIIDMNFKYDESINYKSSEYTKQANSIYDFTNETNILIAKIQYYHVEKKDKEAALLLEVLLKNINDYCSDDNTCLVNILLAMLSSVYSIIFKLLIS